MGSVGGKTPTEPKLIYSSLTLGTSNHVKVNVMCIVHNVSNFIWLWLLSSKGKIYKILAYLDKTMRSRKWYYEQGKEQNYGRTA